MLKYLGITLTTSVTLLIVLMVVAFSFLPVAEEPPGEAQFTPLPPPALPQMVVATPVDTVRFADAPVDTRTLEAELAQRERVYQDQFNQIEQAIQERQTAYQGQMEALSQQITAAQQQLDLLKTQEQPLQTQVAQLESTRTERLSAYQAQLQQAQEQYQAHYAETQAYLAEIQAKLAEVKIQLGQ
jgi:hypothetical protein